jgi:hypothetical protein
MKTPGSVGLASQILASLARYNRYGDSITVAAWTVAPFEI